MSKIRYLLYRSIVTVVLIYCVLTFLFLLFQLMPGSYISVIADGIQDPDTLQRVEAQFGLDQPMHVQYYLYVINLLTLDAGTSFNYQEPVWDIVGQAMINSIILVGPGIIVGYLFGTTIGTYMAQQREKLREKGLFIFSTFSGTVPEFFTSILLIIVFSSWLGLFPSSGMLSIDARIEYGDNYFLIFTSREFWWHYTLPFTAVVIRSIYSPSLIMRTSVMEVKGQEFLYYMRMTGIPKIREMRNLMKHASLPVITAFPNSMTAAIGGMVLIEVVFNWPGIGWLLVNSILIRDFPVVQFVFFMVAVWVILGNFVVDILYSFIDPRITAESER